MLLDNVAADPSVVPLKGPRGPLKGPWDPLKGPRGPLKGPRCPFNGPRGLNVTSVLFSKGMGATAKRHTASRGTALTGGRTFLDRVICDDDATHEPCVCLHGNCEWDSRAELRSGRMAAHIEQLLLGYIEQLLLGEETHFGRGGTAWTKEAHFGRGGTAGQAKGRTREWGGHCWSGHGPSGHGPMSWVFFRCPVPRH